MALFLKSFMAVGILATCTIAAFDMALDANGTLRNAPATRLPDISSSIPVGETQNIGTSHNFDRLRERLESARAAAEALEGYTAILEMQEEVDDQLRPADRIEFKMRRSPFSVFMRWTDNGQEALYVAGENDNRLIVKPTKALAAIRRVWRLEPECSMATRNCRYPITDAGIESLVNRVSEFYSKSEDWTSLATCEHNASRLSGRDVTLFEVKFADRESTPRYCRSKFCFDNTTDLLVAVDNFGWSDTPEPRLVEHYFYDQIAEVSQMTDDDFSENNPDFHFAAK